VSSADASQYLEVRCAKHPPTRVSERLLELGCGAVDERPDHALLAYASSDAELLALVDVLRAEFPGLEVELRPIDVDWALEFSRSLEPTPLTKTLWVAPANKADRVPEGRHCLLLEPAFAFGFGEHPTTRMMSEWLENASRVAPVERLLDFGCGTGILALAGLWFGARRAVGLDIDPAAVHSAHINAERNGLGAQCVFSCDSLHSQNGDFDGVVANVDVSTLLQNAQALATRMSVGGRIALTGFLRDDVAVLTTAFASHGVQLREIEHQDDWALVANWAARG
jgi:ribosomal protein L11 methyltransferase